MDIKEFPFNLGEEVYAIVREDTLGIKEYNVPCDLCEATGKLITITGKTLDCPKCVKGYICDYSKHYYTLVVAKGIVYSINVYIGTDKKIYGHMRIKFDGKHDTHVHLQELNTQVFKTKQEAETQLPILQKKLNEERAKQEQEDDSPKFDVIVGETHE